MKINGWALFVSKIEIVLCMLFGAHALKTGKHKKLAALWLGFEILTQVVTTALSLILHRTAEGSWSKGFKSFKNDLDKEFGVIDDEEIQKLKTENSILKSEIELLKKKPTRRRKAANA